MRTRLRFLTIFLLSSITIWLMIILYNISKQGDEHDQWPVAGRIPNSAEPLVSLGLSDQIVKQQQLGNLVLVESRHKHNSDSNNRINKHYSDGENVINRNIAKFPFALMTTIDTIFYQLDMKTKNELTQNITTKDQHEKETKQASLIKNQVDNHVQIEGDRLFAFNLLASNRIGFFRSLPDTRHELCKTPNANLTLTTYGNNLSTNETSNVANDNYTKEGSNNGTTFFPKHYHNNVKPKASIIICYYNEAPSALLRTIYTVIRRSPPELLHEIIIVDDFSEDDFNHNKIKPFIEKFKMVRLHRTERREGLIRARLLGSKLATAEILLFLDSHVEANEGWLPPLIQQIQLDRTTVACPMIDLINPETMIYTSSPMVVGATSWSLHFKWISVASEKLATNEDFIKPLESPTMAGGLYAIDKDFFHHIGEYDSGMELWGGENVEISFRIWLCGGRVVVLSCSRVGHIFRKRRPYGPAPDKPDCLLYNSHRAARVWLGEYIENFYNAEPGALNLDSGSVDDRLTLKQKIGCKNFDWYIRNVYPPMVDQLVKDSDRKTTQTALKLFKTNNRKRVDRGIHRTMGYYMNDIGVKKVPSFLDLRKSKNSPLKHIDAGKKFQIQAINSEFCIEAKESSFSKGFFRLVLGYCSNMSKNNSDTISSENQLWFKSHFNELRLADNQCLDLIKNLPLLRRCHNLGYFQTWITGNDTESIDIYNVKSALCLAVERARVGEPIIVTLCDKTIYNIINNPNKLDDKMKSTRGVAWNNTQPFWHTGPDMFSQVGKLRFLIQDTPMPIIQKWNILYQKM